MAGRMKRRNVRTKQDERLCDRKSLHQSKRVSHDSYVVIRKKMDELNIYVASYNINGENLDDTEAAAWLCGASASDLVFIGFQEAPVRPTTRFSPCHTYHSDPTIELCRGDVNPQRDSSFVQAVCKALGGFFKKVADVAMGEPANFRTETTKSKQWFGFIRSMVFVNTSGKAAWLATTDRCPASLNSEGNPEMQSPVRALLVPCGIRESLFTHMDFGTSTLHNDNHSKTDTTSNFGPYGNTFCSDSLGPAVGSSPDKGAVALYIAALDLCWVNCHLPATNTHGMLVC